MKKTGAIRFFPVDIALQEKRLAQAAIRYNFFNLNRALNI